MTENTSLMSLLKTLISAPGLSGHEMPVRTIIEDAWRPLTDELTVTRLGSLHGLLRGSLPEPRPSLLLAAHMDEVGLMITNDEEDGIFRFDTVGGLDARQLAGKAVLVGKEHIPGVIGAKPIHLTTSDELERTIGVPGATRPGTRRVALELGVVLRDDVDGHELPAGDREVERSGHELLVGDHDAGFEGNRVAIGISDRVGLVAERIGRCGGPIHPRLQREGAATVAERHRLHRFRMPTKGA